MSRNFSFRLIPIHAVSCQPSAISGHRDRHVDRVSSQPAADVPILCVPVPRGTGTVIAVSGQPSASGNQPVNNCTLTTDHCYTLHTKHYPLKRYTGDGSLCTFFRRFPFTMRVNPRGMRAGPARDRHGHRVSSQLTAHYPLRTRQ